jgi:hypothetical protein
MQTIWRDLLLDGYMGNGWKSQSFRPKRSGVEESLSTTMEDMLYPGIDSMNL